MCSSLLFDSFRGLAFKLGKLKKFHAKGKLSTMYTFKFSAYFDNVTNSVGKARWYECDVTING